jgi:hypothetical protein
VGMGVGKTGEIGSPRLCLTGKAVRKSRPSTPVHMGGRDTPCYCGRVHGQLGWDSFCFPMGGAADPNHDA